MAVLGDIPATGRAGGATSSLHRGRTRSEFLASFQRGGIWEGVEVVETVAV